MSKLKYLVIALVVVILVGGGVISIFKEANKYHDSFASFFTQNDSRTILVVGLAALFFVLIIAYYIAKLRRTNQPQKEAPRIATHITKGLTALVVGALILIGFFVAIFLALGGEFGGFLYIGAFLVLGLYVFIAWILKILRGRKKEF